MSQLPRIAVGTIQAEADGTALVWALMDSFQRAGLRVQYFHSKAYFAPHEGATAITGLSPRHLDSWLMSEELCREVFARGAKPSDLAIVDGSFAHCDRPAASGGDLDTLCRWLDLARLAIVDVRLLGECHLPPRPANIDGLLLDRVADEAELFRLQTLFESLWNIPVLGCLASADALRSSVAAIPPGRQPALELCHALGDQFARHSQLERVYRLAARGPLPLGAARQRCAAPPATPLRVAVAYDEAFHCYFPDTLDLLELNGATISEFSPRRDERLPPDTDIVYLGCGHPELFAAELAENDCMMLALKSHLCSGRRIYAEGGGMAYLCHEIEMPDGQRWPMVGALGATASLDPAPHVPQPLEITLSSDTWLGRTSDRWRGYLNPRWSLAPGSNVQGCVAEPGHQWDVVARQQAIGSRLHLNFAAQGDLLHRFFVPHSMPSPAGCTAASRTV